MSEVDTIRASKEELISILNVCKMAYPSNHKEGWVDVRVGNYSDFADLRRKSAHVLVDTQGYLVSLSLANLSNDVLTEVGITFTMNDLKFKRNFFAKSYEIREDRSGLFRVYRANEATEGFFCVAASEAELRAAITDLGQS